MAARDEASILVIEDDEIKRQSIVKAIEEECPDIAIETAHSVRTAVDLIADSKFALVIADMSLPTFDIEIREPGGTPRPFGGVEVFEYLERMENHVPVLVVTSYPVLTDGKRSLRLQDLEEQLRGDFPNNFTGMIYFDSAYAEWEREFREFLQGLFNR